MHRILSFLKNEFYSFSLMERFVFPLIIFIVFGISVVSKDNFLVLSTSILNILFILLAGKAKYYCNVFGAIGSILYIYIAYQNKLFGTCALYLFVYIPMTTSAFILWRKHLKSGTAEIQKTQLTNKVYLLYILSCFIATIITYFILKYFGDIHPVMDAFITIFSIFGQLLSVKRCFQQWHLWIFVNILSFVMWLDLALSGTPAIAMVFVWFIYSVTAIYFYFIWKKDLKQSFLPR